MGSPLQLSTPALLLLESQPFQSLLVCCSQWSWTTLLPSSFNHFQYQFLGFWDSFFVSFKFEGSLFDCWFIGLWIVKSVLFWPCFAVANLCWCLQELVLNFVGMHHSAVCPPFLASFFVVLVWAPSCGGSDPLASKGWLSIRKPSLLGILFFIATWGRICLVVQCWTVTQKSHGTVMIQDQWLG